MLEKKRAAALGFFDGMHYAHREVIKSACDFAHANNMTATAITFDRHPQSALQNRPEKLINSLESRIKSFHELGIAEVIVLNFDEVRDLSWQDFVRLKLIGEFEVGFVSTGYDFRFGRGGDGNVHVLKDELMQYDIPCVTVKRMTIGGMDYSSSAIRQLVADGLMETAALYLGHHHYLEGEVIHGKALGRTLNSPTMNVAFGHEVILPRAGVYITNVIIDGENHASVTNVGTGNDALAEAYVFDFDRDVYGKFIKIEFMSFVRDMIAFSSIIQLRAQIDADKRAAKKYFRKL